MAVTPFITFLPEFDIPKDKVYTEIKGQKFIIVDDNISTGRTIKGAISAIEEKGGIIVDVYVPTTGFDASDTIFVTDKTWAELESYCIENIIEFAKQNNIKRNISRKGLTEREGSSLRDEYKKTDKGRNSGNQGKTKSGSEKMPGAYTKGKSKRDLETTDIGNFEGTSKDVSNSLPENKNTEKKTEPKKEKDTNKLPESVGAAKTNPKNITHMVNEYGEMKPGENPERFISMPVSTDGVDRVRKFARTAAEAKVTSEKMVQAIEKAVARGDFSHEIWRDSKAIDDAVAYIEKYGYEATLKEFYKRVDNKGQITKGDMTKAMTMYTVAVENDDIKTALKLAVKINKAAVNAGQVVQPVL